MKGATCSICGAAAKVVRGDYRFKECGLKCVILKGIEIIKCHECGNADPIIPRVNALMRGLALAVVNKRYRLQGEEVRFLRKYLGMTGEEFARLVHADKTTISKWENNDDPVGPQSDRLIRAVALALGEGLKDAQERVIKSFAGIHDSPRRVSIQMNTSTMSYQYAQTCGG